MGMYDTIKINKDLLPPNTPKLWYHGTNIKFDKFNIWDIIITVNYR